MTLNIVELFVQIQHMSRRQVG